jgi:hypothetical protein
VHDRLALGERVTQWRKPAGRERQVPEACGAQADFVRP